MASIEQVPSARIGQKLRIPNPEIADRGIVRLGSGSITNGFPLRR